MLGSTTTKHNYDNNDNGNDVDGVKVLECSYIHTKDVRIRKQWIVDTATCGFGVTA